MDIGDLPSEAAPPVEPRRIRVAFERLPGWIERFDVRHPGAAWQVSPTGVSATSTDGTGAAFDVPFGPLNGVGLVDLEDLERHLRRPWHLGIVLVRRGGFAVARVVGAETVAAKVGKRHVQGRTKAGGWSQQRFARRRDNQAQSAYDAAARYVESLLLPSADALNLLATGGDRQAVSTVLAAPALSRLTSRPRRELSVSGDPGRAALDRALAELRSVWVEIVDPPT